MALLISIRQRLNPAGSRGRAWRHTVRIAAAVGASLLCSFAAPTVRAESAATQEYQVKAIFLFRLIQFVEWPKSTLSDTDAPIVIGVLGEDPFGSVLDAAVKGELVRGHAIRVKRSSRIADLRTCHLLFVSQSERAQVPAIISAFTGQPVLTVSDLQDFALRGGVLNFYPEGQKVRFEINRTAAQKAGLKLSSQLLGLARIVGPVPISGDR